MREGYIYRIIAPGSNSVYVGQSYDPHKRFKQHKRFRGDNPKLANWLKKHTDAEIYFWPVIDMDAEEIADEAECRRLGYDLLNLIPCGSTPPSAKGRKRTPETCAKNRAGRLGKKHSSESRSQMSQTRTGRTLTVEHRARLSTAMKGNQRALGAHYSREIRQELSKLRRGKPWSPSRRAAQKERG